MLRLLDQNSRRVGLFFLLPMLATPVLAGSVAFYRHPLLTMRQALRIRLLLSGASERTVVDVGGVPMRYFESIPKDQRMDQGTLVLVHGFGDSAESWSFLLPRLQGELRLVAPDLAGFGRTPIPPEGMSFSVFTDYLSRIKAPTAVVRGEGDGLIPAEQAARMHEEIEGSELVVLPGVGHVPQLQAPKRLADIIRGRLGHSVPCA